MLQNRNILCISNPLWEGDYAKTIVELMSIFATGNKVLYVDNPFTIKDILDAMRGRKKIAVRRAFGLQKRLRQLPVDDTHSVYVLTPPVTLTINFLPKGRLHRMLLNFNGALTARSIQRALKALHMQNDLINITAFNPAIGLPTAHKFKEKLLIYHCYDAIEAANWMKKHGAWLEKEFMQKADAVIVTSQGLYEAKKDFCKRCFLIKNAVNIGLFSAAFSTAVPAKKVVGYIGSIDNRIDYELLQQLISTMHHTQFVFVGRIVSKEAEAMLKKFPNVQLTGPQPVKDLPAYLASFSAGIIPFAQNEFNKGVYPLKVNEYLATGLPVISSNFGYLQDFESIISIAGSARQFIQLVQQEIASDNAEKRTARLSFAQQNSWHQRVEEISAVITSLEKEITHEQLVKKSRFSLAG